MKDEYVFALSAWTIKQDGVLFYIAKTQHWDGKHHWKKPYGSLQLACHAIARNLQREWTSRLEFRQKCERRHKKKAA